MATGDVATGGTLASPPLKLADEHQKMIERECSPLHAAAAMGQLALARRLLMSGADVNRATDTGGETPLHIAAEAGVLPMVQLYI